MSCYLRHLKEILDQAGVEVTSANRKQVDQTIHKIVDVTYKDCPTTWKKLKQDILSNDNKKQEFAKKLQASLK